MRFKMVSHRDVIASNRDAWNASADFHRQSASWPPLIDAVAHKDFSCLDSTLTDQLKQVGITGKAVIQLGCNNGREAISLFALGASEVVGVDQSSEFLKQAHELAERSPYSPVFIESDIHELPASLDQRFDIALITIGVLNWMPNLALFFTHVARTLKPGGTLVIYETHPFLEMLDPEASDPWRISTSYFLAEPLVETGAIVYEGKGEPNELQSYWQLHPLSEVLMSVAGAGLSLRAFDEYPHSNREEVYDVYEQGAAQIPMCYTLVAEKR
ncbi:class I SAM-dependent methyltransferase [Pseudomonas sp. SAR267]|uniref:class I SAM-dependent methyltransferase n=1 Tax=unclassified Pseudomonas TaxID=196821 RepID=UPI00210B05E5|nr:MULTISPECIES: class I SAM-dependent methyltransferase [unclassified Pseudomonas]